MELFLLDTLKTIFLMEDLTQEWTKLGPFFPKSIHFVRFSNKSRGDLPHLPLPSCAPATPVFLLKKDAHLRCYFANSANFFRRATLQNTTEKLCLKNLSSISLLKSDSHRPKIFVSFSSMIAL